MGVNGKSDKDHFIGQLKARSGLWWVERYIGSEEFESMKIDNFERHC